MPNAAFILRRPTVQKRKTVRDVMDRIAKLPHVPVHPVKGMDDPWRYRNKSQIPFSERDGKVVSGFYKSRTHHIVDTDICLIQSQEADELMSTLKHELHALASMHMMKRLTSACCVI